MKLLLPLFPTMCPTEHDFISSFACYINGNLVGGLPFLITQPSLALKPAQKGRLRGQTVAVTGRLEQLDLGDHLKLLQGPSES